ncbi:MAG: hypothetical protein JST82_02805 [Bacteroidetes bacterium]|nr:hypothetical protein [Bacteroidota bacterium]
MPDKITYNWGEDHLQIMLGRQIAPRIKTLFWLEFIFTSGMATIFLIQSMPLKANLIHFAGYLGTATLYALAAYRFISRMFFTEELWLDAEYLTIVNATPFKRKVYRYEWQSAGPLHYVGTDAKTDHPLKGQCYDYFGFETQERLIQNLHTEGKLYFNYYGFPVRFAKGLYSWDAEEVVRMMKIYAGRKLSLGPEWKRMVEESWFEEEN